jgi:hypothetical protein
LEENNIFNDNVSSNIINIHKNLRSFNGRMLTPHMYIDLQENGIRSSHFGDKGKSIGWARVTIITDGIKNGKM